MIAEILILGLAVFGLTEVVKLFLPFSVLSQVKGVVVVVFSGTGAAVLASSIRDGVLLFGATIGAAMLFHAARKAMDGSGEINRVNAMLQIARRMRA